jgi:hypothetical protein
VVDRGREAMPVREALPLRLPREIADAAKANALAQQQAASAPDATDGESRLSGAGTNGSTPAPAGTVYGGGTNSTGLGSTNGVGLGSTNGYHPTGGITSANGHSGNGAAPTSATGSDSDATGKRRPSPRPRRSE